MRLSCIISLIVSGSVSLNPDGTTGPVAPASLEEAARVGDLKALSRYIAEENDMHAEPPRLNAIAEAIINNRVEVYRVLRDHFEADINRASGPEGLTPLRFAVLQGSLSLVRELLDDGADPNLGGLDGVTPLMEAVRKDYSAIVSELIYRGADMNVVSPSGARAISVAISSRSTSSADVLIRAGCLIDAQTLRESITASMDTVAILLIKSGADIHTPDENGETFLITAIRNGRVLLAMSLIEHGSDLTALSSHGESVLELCFHDLDRNWDVMILLLAKRVGVNTPFTTGETPLIHVARRNIPDVAWRLVDRGANVDVTFEGLTAAEIASRNGELDPLEFTRPKRFRKH